MRNIMKRLILLFCSYILAFLFMWAYDFFFERIKEQALEVFMYTSGIIGIIVGFLNCIMNLKKIWIPIIFAPGTFIFLLVMSNEMGAFFRAYWHEKFLYVGSLIFSIAGILIGCSIGKIIRNRP